MRKIVTSVLLVLMGLTSCAPTPTAQAPQPPASDQLGIDPGGTIHVYSPGSLYPIVEVTTSLNYHDRYVRISYRENIETLAGQIRLDIFRIYYHKEITIDLKVVGLPKGITATDTSSGPLISTRVISFNISSDVQPGQYDFQVDVTIDGDDFGTLPCTIKVLR